MAVNSPRYSAWRFVHPVFGTDETGASGGHGLWLAPTGGIDMVQGNQSVRQAIFLLLSTSRGERVMRPDYGCELNRLVFSPNDDTTAGLAIHYVRRALLRWEPRVKILKLDAGRDFFAGGDGQPAQHAPNLDLQAQLYIYLEYQVRTTLMTDQLVLAMNLAGESLL